jgi:hypothetical protein
MKSMLLNSKNFIALLIVIFFMQSIMHYVKVTLEKKKVNYTMKMKFEESFDLYFLNTGDNFNELFQEIKFYNNDLIYSKIEERFQVDKNNINYENPTIFKWKSNIEFENEEQIEKFKRSLQLSSKRNIKSYIKKKIKILTRLSEIDKAVENKENVTIFIVKRFILNEFLEYIDKEGFEPFNELDLLKSKKSISLIENIILTILGSIFLMVLFINRKKLLS